MTKDATFSYYQLMEEEDMILSYKGLCTDRILSSLLEILEIKIRLLDVGIDRERKTLRVMVECFQNLFHHLNVAVDKVDTEKNKAMIVVKRHGEGFIIRTGNLISNDKVEDLRDRLNLVNTLTPDELRVMYRKQLRESELTEKGTAGLGLIDIARKSKNKLDYSFIAIDESYSFFCLSVLIE